MPKFKLLEIADILALLASALFILPCQVGVLGYLEGYFYDLPSISFLALLAIQLFAYACRVCVILYLIFRLFKVSIQFFQSKVIHKKPILINSLTGAILVSSFVSWEYARKPLYIPFLTGFKHKMTKELDIVQLEQWVSHVDFATTDIRSYNLPQFNDQWPKDIIWPKELQKLHPHYINLGKDNKSKPRLALIWGGAMGHWGLIIHPQQTNLNIDSTERVFFITPTSYVWQETQ